jgi:hypothetical protein
MDTNEVAFLRRARDVTMLLIEPSLDPPIEPDEVGSLRPAKATTTINNAQEEKEMHSQQCYELTE